MDNPNNHFRVQMFSKCTKMLFKIRSKCCLVKQNFRCMYFKIDKSDVVKQTIFKHAYLKCA